MCPFLRELGVCSQKYGVRGVRPSLQAAAFQLDRRRAGWFYGPMSWLRVACLLSGNNRQDWTGIRQEMHPGGALCQTQTKAALAKKT